MKTPFPFQRQAINECWRRDVTLLCLEQGLGKTLVAARSLAPPAIIVCPAFLQYNWLDEVEECGYTATLVKSQDDLFRDVDVFIMSYHFLVNLDLAVVLAETFVCDEFHYAKNLDTKRTQAVVAEIECTERVILLSGTPIPSRPVEIYPILDAIGAYTRGYYSFVYRFCAAFKGAYGLNVNGASNLDELREIIAPYVIRFTKKQVLPQLPEKVYRVLSQDLDLPPEEKEYDVSEFYGVAPDIAFETLSTVMRLHAAIKFPIVCDIIDHHFETRSDKLIVFGHHREEMLDPLFEKYAHLNPVRIVGGMNETKKHEAERIFQTDESCRLIVLGILAGGVGLTLTAASRVLVAEGSWVPGDNDQAVDRAHRIGQTEPVEADFVTIRGSIDEYQLKRALEKRRITSQLIHDTKVITMDSQPLADILAKRLAAVAEELTALATDVTALAHGEVPFDEEEEKPTRRRRRASKTDDDAEEEEKPTRRRRQAKKDDDDEEEEKPTRRRRQTKKDSPADQVRAKASEVMKATDRATLNDILSEFEVSKVSDLDPEDFDDFISMCDEAIEEADDE